MVRVPEVRHDPEPTGGSRGGGGLHALELVGETHRETLPALLPAIMIDTALWAALVLGFRLVF